MEWILPSVISFYYIVSNDWKKFYFWINVSLLAKPFFFPVAVIIILFYEKDVLRIIGRVFLSSVGFLCVSFGFRFFPGYLDSLSISNLSKSTLAEYLNNAYLFPYGWASLLTVFVVLVCAFVYFSNYNSGVCLPQMLLMFIAAFFVGWFLFACEDFYRLVMLVPWLYMAMLKEKEHNELMLWITTAYTYVFILAFRFHETAHYFNVDTGMYASIIPHSIIEKTPDFFEMIRAKLGSSFEHVGYMMNGMWVGITIIVIVLLYLHNKGKMTMKATNRERVQRALIWLNVLAIVPLIISALISFVI